MQALFSISGVWPIFPPWTKDLRTRVVLMYFRNFGRSYLQKAHPFPKIMSNIYDTDTSSSFMLIFVALSGIAFCSDVSVEVGIDHQFDLVLYFF